MANTSTQFKIGTIPWNKGQGLFKRCVVCDKEIWVQNNQLNRKKFCSRACKGKMAKTLFKVGHSDMVTKEGRQQQAIKTLGHEPYFNKSGADSPRWIEDRTKIVGRHNRPFHDSDYKQWMLSVKNRDSWRCRIANQDCDDRLEVHHILPWREFVELRYEINNGITLCHAHHPRNRAEEKRLILNFQGLVTVSKVHNR